MYNKQEMQRQADQQRLKLVQQLADQKMVLDVLREVWKKFPDLRLGQLISNVIIGTSHGEDPFYVSDAEMMAFLTRYAIENERK
jgi:hypothetical protein